jgi:2,3-bisphosphoglycerate-dependent phosphoglycerate mutase
MADEREYRQAPFAPPPGALDLLLVRHGASMPWSPGRDFALADGHGDPGLSPDGVEQAQKVAVRLATERVDAIYVTSLRRTHETAAPLARLTGIEPRVEPDLREVYLGEWEGGLFRQKVAEADPLAVRMFELERWDVIPGAEDGAAFAARVRGAVMRLAAAHPDQRVVAFTHGGVIGSVLQQAARSRGFAFSNSDNASISQVVVVGDRWIFRRFNDTAHLTPAFSMVGAPPL